MEQIFLFFCTMWLAVASAWAQDYYNALSSKDFESFKNAVVPCAVYFVSKSPEKLKKDWQVKEFLTNFMDSGRYLTDFSVNFATVDCHSDPVQDYCSRDNARSTLFVFRHGHILTELPMDSLYSVDSIISNMLHLVLLREVPLIQEPADLASMQQRHKGHKDILFAKMIAVGTSEHRAFMEGAFAYGHLYKFVMTTNMGTNMLGPGSEEEWEEQENRVWLLQCKQASSLDLCHRSFFRGKMRVADFALYLKTLDVLPYTEYKAPGGTVLYQQLGIPTAYLYSNAADYRYHKEMVQDLSQTYRGNLGFVLVNSDVTPESVVADIERCQPPCLMLQRAPEENLIHMEDDLTVENVAEFIEDNMYIRENPSEIQEEYDPVPVQEVQDDEVQHAVYSDTRILDMAHVPKLTDKTFPEFISDTGLVIVLFTVRWDPRCKAFLESYSNAAHTIQQDIPATDRPPVGPLAQVECFNWPDVCQLGNVTAYPTIQLYREGKLVTDYRGSLSEAGILKAYRLHSTANPVVLDSCPDCQAISKGELPSWVSSTLPAVVIGYFPDASTKERSEFEHAAKMLHGQHLMAVCFKDCTQHSSDTDGSKPMVTAFKWGDHHQPLVQYSGDYTTDSLVQFVQTATLPLVPELSPSNLPLHFAKGKPFLILFKDVDDQSREAEASLASLAREKTFESTLTIVWIDVSQPSSIGSKILKDYGIRRQLLHPSMVFVDHATNRVCNYPADYSFKAPAMANWIVIVLNGETSCSGLMESKFEPQVSPYDFLALIEKDKKEGTQRMGRLATEHHHDDEEGVETEEDKEEVEQGPGQQFVSGEHRHTEL
ncbi:thioredoxin domain-containing protein 16-like [Acanthaster planci]|uniref:Thioredoxin domain-containing protein 16-like n=1 Tax=Acanthaster planci TaxID=133434 RepID=A0A8B7YG61_ACAPL|nr:thioredoxin domain-containing protein 16-like [Acanthaster planci]